MSAASDRGASTTYCPKCGSALEERKGELYCAAGDMGLSQHVADAISRLYSDPPSEEPPYRWQMHGGIRWFCPRCGQALDRKLHCEACDRHLRSLAYHLIEFHPHRTRSALAVLLERLRRE